MVLNYCYLINVHIFRAFSFPCAILGRHKNCTEHRWLHTFWLKKQTKKWTKRRKRRNQIGSKLQDLVYQNIVNYIFESWFVFFGLFKLTVNDIVREKYHLRLLLHFVLLLIENPSPLWLFPDIETMRCAGPTGKLDQIWWLRLKMNLIINHRSNRMKWLKRNKNFRSVL